MMDGSRLQGKNLLNIPSVRRNPVLADVFSRLIYMERRGSGFKKIIGDYQFQENYTEKMRPVFDAQRGYFTLTLYNLNYIDHQGELQGQDVPQNDTNNVPQDDTDKLQNELQGELQGQNDIKNDPQDDTQGLGVTIDELQDDVQVDKLKEIDKKIILKIKENPKVTITQMAKALGTSASTIKRRISAIKIVYYVGHGYSGHWEVRE